MNVIQRKIEAFIDGQYRRPSGLVGQLIGERMAQQHRSENEWTVSLLNLQPEDRVLEIGFGPGIAIQLLAKQLPRGYVAGIDFSTEMLSLASKRNREAIKAGGVTLRCGEAASLPLASESFDKALSIHTLYFLREPIEALGEVLRVLKSGGIFALAFLSREHWPTSEPAGTISGVYSGDEVVRLMKEAGFAHAHVERGPDPRSFREIAAVGIK